MAKVVAVVGPGVGHALLPQSGGVVHGPVHVTDLVAKDVAPGTRQVDGTNRLTVANGAGVGNATDAIGSPGRDQHGHVGPAPDCGKVVPASGLGKLYHHISEVTIVDVASFNAMHSQTDG